MIDASLVFKIYLLVLMFLNIIATVAMINKPREPISPGMGAFLTLWGALHFSGVYYLL